MTATFAVLNPLSCENSPGAAGSDACIISPQQQKNTCSVHCARKRLNDEVKVLPVLH